MSKFNEFKIDWKELNKHIEQETLNMESFNKNISIIIIIDYQAFTQLQTNCSA